MKGLRELPLAQKLILTMMATSSVALLVASLSVFSYDVFAFRHSVATHLDSLGGIVGANVTAALSFRDPKSAGLVLQALHAEPHIVAAGIYDVNGRAFASYRRDSSSALALPTSPPAVGSHLEQGRITDCQPIVLDGETVGFVYLESDTQELHARRQRYVLFVVIFTAVSSTAAFMVALLLKRFISRPILELLQTTKTVSEQKNFAIRAVPYTKDELGLLAEGFNEMLGEIEKRDQALRTAHTESELFFNSVPSILIGTDNQGLITRWNPAAASTFALPAPGVRGKSLQSCGVHWLQTQAAEEIDSWLRVERSAHRVLMFAKDHETRFLDATISRVEFPNEKNAGFLITATDTTEKRHLEEQLRQAQKLEAIGQLAAGIAHEINTPTQFVGDNTRFLKESWNDIKELLSLCQIIGDQYAAGAVAPETISQLSQRIKDADLAYLLEQTPRAIDESLEGLGRVSKIVRAMKEFSHPGSSEKQAVDINRAIETTVTVARNEWKYVAEVRTHLDAELPLVPCFAAEFNQVILNLLINAAQAIGDVVGDGSSGKGTITVSTQRDGDGAEIRIQDTGKGVPEEIRSRIFEPFFTTKPVGKGTGQGLALAHSVIVKMHKGRIWFDSEVGKGTTFFVRLPLTDQTTETLASARPQES